MRIREGITIPQPLGESTLDSVGFTVYRGTLTQNTMTLAQNMLQAYKAGSTISRVVNQIVEQVMADGNIAPAIQAPEKISEPLQGWWNSESITHLLRQSFKEYLLSGEVWLYVPRRNKKEGVKVYTLVPWYINTVEGTSARAWSKASYVNAKTGENYPLTPENTVFVAHDALFGELRGITPFASLYFATQTYEDWLQGRIRINRLSGNIIGKMHFPDLESAASSLLNARVVHDPDGDYLEVDGPVEIPKPGTMAVLIGEGSDFQLVTPNVGASTAKDDGEAIWRMVIEATRLPEFLSGWGRGVNVATARVQYPFAVRMMLALRDEFDDAIQMMVRLVLQRFAQNRIIPPTWRDDNGNEWTPATVPVHISWPEVRELDFDAISRTVLELLKLQVIDPSAGLYMLGWSKDELEQIAMANEAVGGATDPSKIAQTIQEALNAWLEQKLNEGAPDTSAD